MDKEQNFEGVRGFPLGSFAISWEQRKLSDVATMHARIGWQNLRTSEFLDSGDYMLITGTDFNDGAVNYSAYTGPRAPYARRISPTPPEGSPTVPK